MHDILKESSNAQLLGGHQWGLHVSKQPQCDALIVACRLQAVPSSLKAYIKTVRIVVPAKFVPCDFHETLATLDIASGRPDMQIQVGCTSAPMSLFEYAG